MISFGDYRDSSAENSSLFETCWLDLEVIMFSEMNQEFLGNTNGSIPVENMSDESKFTSQEN